MTCRLCLEKHDLQGTHIVPEFLYRPLYDSTTRNLLKVEPDKKGWQVI